MRNAQPFMAMASTAGRSVHVPSCAPARSPGCIPTRFRSPASGCERTGSLLQPRRWVRVLGMERESVSLRLYAEMLRRKGLSIADAQPMPEKPDPWFLILSWKAREEGAYRQWFMAHLGRRFLVPKVRAAPRPRDAASVAARWCHRSSLRTWSRTSDSSNASGTSAALRARWDSWRAQRCGRR